MVGGSAVGGSEGERRGLNLCVVPSPNGWLSLSIWEWIEIEKRKSSGEAEGINSLVDYKLEN
jgi:hypothetical protein